MEWIQTITIIGVMSGLFGIFASMMYWMVSRIDSDVKSCCARLDGHAMRIDQTYKIIMEILKEGRK